ncbi:MAG: cation:proton antiporter [Planctomycetota bacterium]
MTLTLAAGGNAQVMLDLLLVLAAAATVSLIVRRLKIAAIAGYLVAGAVFGPNAIGLISDSESIASISQIAIVMLMFGIGLHLDRSDLRAGLAPILAIGALSTIGTTAIGTPIAKLFGMHWPAALTVATAVAMSSTAVVLRTLQQRRELRQAHGRIAFGTLITQDMAVVIILAGMPVVAGWAKAAQGIETVGGEPIQIATLVTKSAITIGLMALMIVAGLTLLPKLLAEAARDSSNETLLVLSAAFGLGAAVLTAYLDLSPELGAFLAGFLLAGTPFRFQLSGQIGPMRDLFMAVFFTAVGLQLDIGAIAGIWWVVLIGFALVLGLKLFTIAGSAWLLGAPPAVALTTGITLAQAGEFTLVVLGFATAAGIFDGNLMIVPSAMIAVVFLSLLVTPPMMAVSRSWGAVASGWPQAPWFRRASLARASQDAADDKAYRVVVAGFGPVGRSIVDKLVARGVRVSVIELNRKTVERQTSLGRSIVYGDVTNPEVLESAGIAQADAVVLTIPDDDAMLRACKAIRGINASAFIAARTNFLSKAFLAKELGANHVTVEELATAEVMASQVLGCFDANVLRPAAQSGESPEASSEAAATNQDSEPVTRASS